MANELASQLDSSKRSKQSSESIEFTYPRLPVPASFINLSSRSASTKMANGPQSDNQDTALSESWATLSDADYSIEDDLRSETTDAASLVDNVGLDDVHSLDDQTSDAGSRDGHSDKNVHHESHPENPLVESTKTMGTESVGALKASGLGRSIELEPRESQTEIGFTEVGQNIHSFSDEEAEDIMGYSSQDDECHRIVGSVGMIVSKNNLNLDRPLRLLYVGDTSARADILAKIGDALTAGPELQRDRCRMDSSRYHVIRPSDASDSSSNHADLIPIKTQIIVDDCSTAASIKVDQAPDQIFLSFKNGSLYSSRWNGTAYEISSASAWSTPDLAVFFVSHDDHPVLKQRLHLAHAFLSRHQISALIISENSDWASPFTELEIDHWTPHLRVEAQRSQSSDASSTLRRLPIDLQTFQCLESDQLNRNLASLCERASVKATIDISGTLSEVSDPSRDKVHACRRKASRQKSSIPITWHSLCTDSPLLGTILFSVAGLLFLVIGILACNTAVSTSVYLLSSAGNVSVLFPAASWILRPSLGPTVLVKTAHAIQTSSAPTVTSSNTITKSLATVDMQSDLAKLINSKTLQATNMSEKFQVHSIGDCHIVVKTPRGFKVGNKSTPFDVVITRGAGVLKSSLSRLFDGVYTVRVDREEAYGVLNVTIRRHKPSILEEHRVDFGAQWLKMAGWKKAAQIASEQVRTDLNAAQTALSTTCDRMAADMQAKSIDISKKAARQAKQFTLQSRYFLNSTANLLKAKSKQLRCTSKREGREAYTALSVRADLAFKTLLAYTDVTNKRGRAAIEKIMITAFETAEHIQQVTLQIDLAEVQNKMQEYMRSENLSTAQERAKQIVKDASSRWRQRRAVRKARRAANGKKGKGCNR